MIWAGMVYLQEHTNMTEDEIRKLPYPKFKSMIDYNADPEAFIKGGISQKDYEDAVKEAQQQNMDMMRKAREKRDRIEKERQEKLN